MALPHVPGARELHHRPHARGARREGLRPPDGRGRRHAGGLRLIHSGGAASHTAPGDRTPDEKHSDCADYRADKPSALARLIPPKRLTKVGGDDGTDNVRAAIKVLIGLRRRC